MADELADPSPRHPAEVEQQDAAVRQIVRADLVYIAVFDRDFFGLVEISPVVFYGVIIVIVMAVFVVLLTTTVGYLRAKQAAIARCATKTIPRRVTSGA